MKTERLFDTSQIEVPSKIVDQIIGQDEAVGILKKAVTLRRNLLMIGIPGIGKSMIAKAYAELLGKEETDDLLAYYNKENPFHPLTKTVSRGKGEQLIDDLQKQQTSIIKSISGYTVEIIFMLSLLIYLLFQGFSITTFLLGVLIIMIYSSNKPSREVKISIETPKLLIKGSNKARFIDATGYKRSGLFGDVLHDPYQSGGLETPAHKRLIPGAVHLANLGVLYVDEVGTLDYDVQVELLTVLQERKTPIMGRSRESITSSVSTDPIDANFALVLSGNLETVENIHPAIRSRIQGYGYEVNLRTSMEDSEENRMTLIRFIAQEVRNDGNIPHFDREATEEIIEIARILSNEPLGLTLELRKLGGIIRKAGDVALSKNLQLVGIPEVKEGKLLAKPIDVDFQTLVIPKKGVVIPSNQFNTMKIAVFSYEARGDQNLIVTGISQDESETLIQLYRQTIQGTIFVEDGSETTFNQKRLAIETLQIIGSKSSVVFCLGELQEDGVKLRGNTLKQFSNLTLLVDLGYIDIDNFIILCPKELEGRLLKHKYNFSTSLHDLKSKI